MWMLTWAGAFTSYCQSNRILSKVYTPRSQDLTMMGKGFSSVSFASGVVKRKLLDETTIK